MLSWYVSVALLRYGKTIYGGVRGIPIDFYQTVLRLSFMENTIKQRLELLRAQMKQQGMDAYIIPTADFHNSEYVAPFFKAREFFSGFTGSAGILVVGLTEAALWADGRYFIQAEQEIAGTDIILQRMGEPGVPTLHEYLKEKLPEGGTLGFDGRCITMGEGNEYEKLLASKHITLKYGMDLADKVWQDRPALPSSNVFLLKDEYTGENMTSKVSRLRKKMEEAGAAYYVSSKLDEIMWLYNIRGGDVECNPVALSYAVVTPDHMYLFVQDSEISMELRGYAQEYGLELRGYDMFFTFLERYDFEGKILVDPDYTSFTVYQALKANAEAAGKKIEDVLLTDCSPVDYMKSIKNEVEIRNFKESYIEDSAQLTKFIYWLKTNIGRIPMTEGSAAAYLDGLRAQIHDYVELSFPTISAYGSNAAMMHYEPDENGGAELKPEGMLLVDSGGHYLRGSTDVTRTMSLGPVTDDMKKSYTLTAVSNMQLMNTVFLHGCSGIALDIMAREPMWREGMDYKCGTGHGIGYLLNVHEGPQTIRYRKRDAADMTAFEAGMVITDEPGVYKAGQYGIRIENVLLTVDKQTTSDGRFLGFEPITFVPLDRELIDVNYLTQETREVINQYHKETYEKLAPFMNEEELAWLAEQCAEI